jgi:hypothetical protein
MYSAVLVKKDSKMSFSSKQDKILFNLFLEKLKEGDMVEIFISPKGKKANNAQISKVHACIRVLASELGYSFTEMKNIIKKRSGLVMYDEDEMTFKSFGECTTEEISSAIESCNDLGRDMNIIL